MTMTRPGVDAERHLTRSILYLRVLLADRPRVIDRYIHYFGETPQRAGGTGHAVLLGERREVPFN